MSERKLVEETTKVVRYHERPFVKWSELQDPHGILTDGAIYEVDRIEVHSWHTRVYLKGLQGRFNSLDFEDVGPEVQELSLAAARMSAAKDTAAKFYWLAMVIAIAVIALVYSEFASKRLWVSGWFILALLTGSVGMFVTGRSVVREEQRRQQAGIGSR